MTQGSVHQHRMAIDDVHFFVDMLPGIQGVELYPDRSTVHPYAVVYLSGAGDVAQATSHHKDYLRPMGIGPSELRFVPGEDLFAGIMGSPNLRDQLRTELSNGSGLTLEAFASYGRWPEFVQALGLDHARLRTSLDLALVRELDDKAGLRKFAKRHFGEEGLTHVPAHTYAETSKELWRRVDDMLETHSGLVVKRPDLEGGESMLCVGETTELGDLREWAQKYCDGTAPVLIEEDLRIRPGVATVECSLQWYLPPGGDPQKRFFSTQDVTNNAHRGNGIANQSYDALPTWIPEGVRIKMVRAAWKLTQRYIEIYRTRGYVGLIGFDFMIVVNPDFTFSVVLLEVNVRKTAGTYLESLRWHVEQTRLPGACAAMRNVKPYGVTHWQQAVARLRDPFHPDSAGNISFNKDTGVGVLVFAPRMLPHKLVVIAVASTIVQAHELLNTAELRLCHPSQAPGSRIWSAVQRVRRRMFSAAE